MINYWGTARGHKGTHHSIGAHISIVSPGLSYVFFLVFCAPIVPVCTTISWFSLPFPPEVTNLTLYFF